MSRPVVTVIQSVHVSLDGLESVGPLVSPGNVEAMAEAIASLLDDPALRRRLGEAAGRAATGFAFAAIVPREMAGLKSLLTGSARPRSNDA